MRRVNNKQIKKEAALIEKEYFNTVAVPGSARSSLLCAQYAVLHSVLDTRKSGMCRLCSNANYAFHFGVGSNIIGDRVSAADWLCTALQEEPGQQMSASARRNGRNTDSLAPASILPGN